MNVLPVQRNLGDTTLFIGFLRWSTGPRTVTKKKIRAFKKVMHKTTHSLLFTVGYGQPD